MPVVVNVEVWVYYYDPGFVEFPTHFMLLGFPSIGTFFSWLEHWRAPWVIMYWRAYLE